MLRLCSCEGAWYRDTAAIAKAFALDMHMPVIVDMDAFFASHLLYCIFWEWQKGTKEEMLSYWQFGEDFGLVHLNHAAVDFVPCFDLLNEVSFIPLAVLGLTAEISSSMGECQRREAVLICINECQHKCRAPKISLTESTN